MIDDLAKIGDVTGFGPDEDILLAGESPRALHILLSGFAVETQERLGRSVATDVVGPFCPIQLAQTLAGTPAKTRVKTITSARIVLLQALELRSLVQQQEELLRTMFTHTLRAVEFTAEQLRHIKLTSAVQRLAQFLLARMDLSAGPPGRIILPYEKRYLAGKLGCSQETLSRAFAALRKLGVASKGSVVVVKDAVSLEGLARGVDVPNEPTSVAGPLHVEPARRHA
ncbi:MAG: hypothetical protein BGO51_03100 [Rhodospirillales bacterium 69-11]|nr:MAG: hypothetical protein BGO51_03100 [Rhodospirillales bacterium 69-11]